MTIQEIKVKWIKGEKKMNKALFIILMILFAYLFGSVNFATLFTYLKRGIDIRELGDHNPGATNVYLNVDKRLGVLVFILDASKGFIPLMITKRAGGSDALLLAVALFAILGHDYSIFYHFRGGTGISTTIGCGLFFAPEEMFIIALFTVPTMYFLLYLKKKNSSILPLETGESIAYVSFLLSIFVRGIPNEVKMFFLIATMIVVIRRFDAVQHLFKEHRLFWRY